MDCLATEYETLMGLDNTYTMNTENKHFPASFRVIGVGHGIENVINEINSFGFEGVSAEVVKYPFDCTPQDEDKLAIICFTDCDDNANRIAKIFHDAGVLTIGFGEDAVPTYYDSIMEHVRSSDYPKIIKSLLQPIVTSGMISYDFNDLSSILRDSEYFTVRSTSGNSVKEATEKLQGVFNEIDLKCVDYLSIHLYFNPERSIPLAMNNMTSLSQLMSVLPETINVIWSVNKDEKLNGDEIRLSVILAGKEVWKCQTT